MANQDAHRPNSYDLVCFCILPHGMIQPENCICPAFVSGHMVSLHKFVYVVKTQLRGYLFQRLLFSQKNRVWFKFAIEDYNEEDYILFSQKIILIIHRGYAVLSLWKNCNKTPIQSVRT